MTVLDRIAGMLHLSTSPPDDGPEHHDPSPAELRRAAREAEELRASTEVLRAKVEMLQASGE